VLATISDTLWNNVLTRHRFSTSGAAQLQADLAAICRVVHGAVGSGVAEAGLRKCIEGAHLVGLPVKGSKSEATSRAPGTSTEETEAEWEAWGGEAEGTEGQDEEAAGGDEVLGLWEVERRLFADNQSARDVLEELGLELLSEAEARTVLGKRVELAG
jgi:hypothetical protein